MSKIQSINEAYIGDEPTKIALSTLSKLRRKYILDPTKSFDWKYISKKPYHGDPLIEKFDRDMENLFGFGTFVLIIENEKQPNAYTIPISWAWDAGQPNQWVYVDKKGYHYNKRVNYFTSVTIHDGLIFDPKYTDREIFGIILHEVGHNFSGAVNPRCVPINLFYQTIGCLLTLNLNIPAILQLTQGGQRFKNAVRDFCYDNFPVLMEALNGYWNVMSEVRKFNMELFQIISYALGSNPVTGVLAGLIDAFFFVYDNLHIFGLFNILTGYQDEEFADAFATMYGYGPDISNGFKKMEINSIVRNKMREKCPLYHNLAELYKLPGLIIIYGIDPHPENPARVKNSIRVLESSLETADPKVKKRIKDDINKMDSQYKKYVAYHNASMMEDPDKISKIYASFLYNSLDGDLRHIINDKVFNHQKYLGSNKDIDRISTDLSKT